MLPPSRATSLSPLVLTPCCSLADSPRLRCPSVRAALLSGVSAVTIGELPICTPAKDVLAGEDFTTLSAALAAAKDVDVGSIPDGTLVVVAPTNEAFAAALT